MDSRPDQPTATPGDGAPHVVQRIDFTAKRPYTNRVYAARLLWTYIGRPLFRHSPTRVFSFRRWLLRRFGATVGAHAVFYPSVVIFHPWWFTTDDYCTVAYDVVIYNLGPVAIGNHTVLSQGVYLCAGSHDYTLPNLPLTRPPIRIGNGVWIAAQAFIGPGVTVGDNSVVGARSVVIKDVPPGVVVGGNPARVIKPRTTTETKDAL